jgi:hypothetical protein
MRFSSSARARDTGDDGLRRRRRDLMGIFGRAVHLEVFLGIGYTQYIQHTFDAVKSATSSPA